MPPNTFTSAVFSALLLAGTAHIACAEPPETTTEPLFNDEQVARAIETGYLFDLDLAWQPLDPNAKYSFASGATPAASSNSTKPAFGAEETQSAIARALKSGYSVGIDPSAMPAQLNRGLEVTDSFKAGFKAGFDAPVGDEMRLTAAAVETQYSLGRIGSAMSWSWFTGVDMKPPTDGTSAVSAGPQFKLGGDKLALTLKPQVAHTFSTGPHRGEEFAFNYAAGLKGEVAKGLALGIEAFGATTNDVSSVAGMPAHLYRGSPALYVGLGLVPPTSLDAGASKFSLEVGALTGTTETERDVTGRIKAAVTW